MRISRIITALAVGLAVASLPTAAGAQPAYPPQVPSLTLSDTTVVVGTTVTLSGTNFGPNETVDIAITTTPLAARAPGTTNTRSGTTTVAMAMVPVSRKLPARVDAGSLQAFTDANGDFQVDYTPRYKGEYTFTVTGRESGLTASATLLVIKHRRPHLPVTGNDVGPQIAVGSGLLVTGVVLMLVTMLWRRRNRRRGEVS